MADWARSKYLSLSITKSHSTLFTADTHQSHIDSGVLLKGEPLSVQRHDKVMEHLFDTHFTFTPYELHYRAMCLSAPYPKSTSLCSVRTTKGNLCTEQSSAQSSSMQALWHPNASNSAVGRLKNTDRRIAFGSLRMASISHLQRTSSCYRWWTLLHS